VRRILHNLFSWTPRSRTCAASRQRAYAQSASARRPGRPCSEPAQDGPAPGLKNAPTNAISFAGFSIVLGCHEVRKERGWDTTVVRKAARSHVATFGFRKEDVGNREGLENPHPSHPEGSGTHGFRPRPEDQHSAQPSRRAGKDEPPADLDSFSLPTTSAYVKRINPAHQGFLIEHIV
jgi:hypothetical protein